MAKKLIVEIIGDASSLEATLGKAAAATSTFGGKLKAASAEMTAAGTTLTKGFTLPVVAIGAAGTKMAVDFQASMELLHTQAGVSQKAVESLSRSVLGMAGSVATTPETLSTGLYHLASQGLRGAQAMSALRIAAEGAKIGQANLEDVTNALGAVLVSGIKGSKDYSQAMGQLNATVGAGDMRMQDLADAMGTGLPAKAAIFGVSLRDVSAALAVFGDNNIRGAEAGTQLNSTMRIMAAPSGAAAKALKGVGISAGQLGNDLRSGGFVKAITDLKTHFTDLGLTATQQAEVLTHAFGGRQAGGVMILMDQLERLKQKEQAVADGGNKFASEWAAYTQTAAYKADQLGASMSAAGISIGNILLPFVSKAVNALSELADKFSALPGPVKDLIVVAGITVAAIGPLVGAIGGLGEAIGFLVANPIVLAIAAVAALGAAIAFAVLAPQKLQSALEGLGLSATTSARIVHDLQDAFGYLKQAGQVLASAVRSHWGQISAVIQGTEQIVTGVVNVLQALWRQFGSNITQQATLAWNLVKATIQNALTVIEGVVNVFAGILHGNWSQVWDGVKQIVSGVWNQIEAIFHYEVGTLGNLADAIGKALWAGFKAGADLVLKLMEALPGKILAALGDLGKLLVNAGEQLMNGLKQGIANEAHSVLDKIKGVGSDIKHAALGAFHINSPSRDFIEIGEGLMEGLSVGVDTGSKDAIKALKTTLAKARAAINADQDLVEQAARLLGVAATQGIVNGALGVQQTAAQQLRQALEQAMAPALAQEAASGAIRNAAAQIGEKAADAVVAGVVGKQPSMTQQIKTALAGAVQQAAQQAQQSIQSFQSSFGSLASGILSAFQTQTGSFVAPAQKLLNKEQLADQVAQYKDAVAQAATTLKTDQQALADAQAGGDPAAIQAAQAQVLADQQAYAAAVRQQLEFNQQQLAIKQTAAYNDQRAKQQEALAKQLADLEKALSKNPKLWDTMGKKVGAILDKYGVPMFQSGQKFASQFSDGIKSQLAAVEEAAKKMAEAVAKYVPRSPAKTGPLAFSSQAAGAKFGREFAQGISVGLYNGQGLANVAEVFATSTRGALVDAGIAGTSTLGPAASAGGTPTVIVNVQGSLLGSTPEQIVDVLMPAISRGVVEAGNNGHPYWRGVTKASLSA